MDVFFGQLVGFAVIFFCFWKWLLPMVKKAMKTRQDTVRAQLEDAKLAAARLADAGNAKVDARERSEQEGSIIRDSARGDAESLQVDYRTQAEREAARIVEHGEGVVHLNRANLVRGLRGELGTQAVGIADEVVRGHLAEPAARSASIDRTLDELEQMAGSVDPDRITEADRIGSRSLGAASRESVRALSAGFASRVSELDGAALDQLGDDLAAVVETLIGQPVLRKHLVDASGAVDAKKAMVGRLFTGKIGPAAVSFVQEAAASQWSAPADFSFVIERQSQVAVLIGAERDGQIDETEDELFRAGRALVDEPRLTALLSDTRVPAEERIALLNSVFGGKVNRHTGKLLEQTVGLLRHGRVDTAVAAVSELAAARRDETIAHIETAEPLSAAQQDRLSGLLERIYRRKVAVQTELRPELLGGLRVTVGNEIIDGDIASRLARAQEQLPR
jgi:ATP synthase F1 delta subunit